MGYFWYMSVETASGDAAHAFAAAFDASPIVVSDPGFGFSHTINLVVSAERKDNLWWGVSIFPTFAEGRDAVASSGGAESVEHAKILSLLGDVLYERLLRAGPFDLALAGFEVEGMFGFGEHDDLVDDLRQGWTDDGLVISEALWEAAGRPKTLVPRSDGTYWFPWKGESFQRRT